MSVLRIEGATEMKLLETEEDFKSWVIDCAHLFGWRLAHFRPGMTQKGWRTPVEADGGGYPDLTLVRERVIWAEIKSEKGKLSQGQQEWLDTLKAAGQEVYIWRPGDRDRIQEILARG